MKTKPKVQNRSTKTDITTKQFPRACADELAAVEFMEEKRWGKEPNCPHCGSVSVYKMKDSKTSQRQANFRWRCHDCKQQYTVRIGTVFEDSRIPMRHWCYGFWRAATSKKGVSALEIHRQTGLSYKSALFMLNRIRFAMTGSAPEPLKGLVEVDETYIGGKPRFEGKAVRGRGTHKQPVMALVERQGKVRAQLIHATTSEEFKGTIKKNVAWNSAIITDEHGAYIGIEKFYLGGHHVTNHRRKEYARGPIHSNTAESFFALFKRGLNGIYHSVTKRHLHRYLAEFEFRYNHREIDDGDRAVAAIKGAEGKRLTYKECRAA